MIGMSFISFIILVVISIIASAILHFGCKHYVEAGWWSFVSKVIVGWVGAWIGTPVFGHWPQMLHLQYENIYIIPAFIGAFALVIVAVDLVKMSLKGKA